MTPDAHFTKRFAAREWWYVRINGVNVEVFNYPSRTWSEMRERYRGREIIHHEKVSN